MAAYSSDSEDVCVATVGSNVGAGVGVGANVGGAVGFRLGALVGPPGFYVLVGGSLAPPAPEKPEEPGDDVCAKIAKLAAENPDNICLNTFDPELYTYAVELFEAHPHAGALPRDHGARTQVAFFARVGGQSCLRRLRGGLQGARVHLGLPRRRASLHATSSQGPNYSGLRVPSLELHSMWSARSTIAALPYAGGGAGAGDAAQEPMPRLVDRARLEHVENPVDLRCDDCASSALRTT